MNKIGKWILLVLALSLLLSFAGCAEPAQPTGNAGTEGNSGQVEYCVRVCDAAGNPVTDGVVVRFLTGDTQAAMQTLDQTGAAKKTLAAGEYTVELVFTDASASFHYDTENLTLTSEVTELTITLAQSVIGEPQNIFAGGKDHEAYHVHSGTTYVALNSGEMTYFLFAPQEAGTYRFSMEGATVGYYGGAHFVQEQSAADIIDNAVSVSISSGMIGNVMVIGVQSDAAEGVLNVERTGEPAWTLEDAPWTEYVPTHTPEPFTLELAPGQNLTYVDITDMDSDIQVVLGQDGFYHVGSADGPVLYMTLGKKAPYVSLQVIIQGDGPMGGAPIRHYFYDENGEFVKKEDYTNLLGTYFACMDEEYGVYPMTQDLRYILENACSGWWDASSPNYILDDCNPDIGWLFAGCYVEG